MDWEEEDKKLLLTETRRQEILANLRKERELRKELISKGEVLRLSNSDLSGSARSSLEAADPLSLLKAALRDQTQQERLLISPKPDQSSLKKEGRPPLSKRPPSARLSKQSAEPENTSRGTRSSPGTPRHSQRSRESDVQAIKQEMERGWTFRPSISPLGKREDEGVGDRLERLSKPKSVIVQEREREKERLDRERLSACTFQPSVTPYLSSRLDQESSVSLRLHEEAAQRTQSKELLAARHEETELANYTFHPRTHSAGQGGLPLHKRLEQVSQRRQDLLQKLKQAIEEAETDLTFKPEVNGNSAKMYSERMKKRELAGARVEEKLRKEAEESEARRQRLLAETEAKQRDLCTFKPQTSAGKAVGSTFEDRQALLLEKKRQERTAAEPECTFHPHILPTKPRTLSPYQRLQQLSTPDAKKHSLAAERASQDFQEKHPFEPQIDPLSRRLGRSSTLSELAYNAEKRTAQRLQAAAAEEAFSFHPSLYSNGRKAQAVSEYSQRQNISLNISAKFSEKELRLGEYRKRREEEELRECTFTPKTVTPRQENSPVVVRGLDQFFQHRDRARRLSAELREREAKAFNSDIHLHPSHGLITTPQPFHLRPSSKAARVEKLHTEVRSKELQECSFRPDTKASQLRGQIQSLLALLGD